MGSGITRNKTQYFIIYLVINKYWNVTSQKKAGRVSRVNVKMWKIKFVQTDLMVV